MASGPITSWQIDGETMETVRGFIFLGSKGASFTSVKGVGHDGSKLAHIHIHVSILPDSPPMHTLILLFFFLLRMQFSSTYNSLFTLNAQEDLQYPSIKIPPTVVHKHLRKKGTVNFFF